jgi:hypothetical protein
MDFPQYRMKLKVIIILTIILITTDVALSITETNIKSGTASYSPSNYGTKDHLQVSSAPGAASNRVTISHGDSGGSGPSRTSAQPAITVTSERDPIKIVKIVTPRIKDGERRLGEMAQVRVEIYSNQNEPINLSIREFVDENIPVFRASANAYLLKGPDEISYYKLGLLEDLELGCLDKSICRTSVTFCDFNCSIEKSRIKGYNVFEKNHEYMRTKPPLLSWPLKNNCSLSNYPNLVNYLMRLLNLKNITLNNMTINITRGGNLSIQYNGNITINISNNSLDPLDKGNAILTYNGLAHHLLFIQNKTNNKLYDVYDTSNIIPLDNINLEPDSIIVFWYNLMPYNPGVYDTETLVIMDKPTEVLSAHLEIEIDEDIPQFEVSRKFTSPRIFKWDELGIQYHIDYIGGGSRNQMKSVPINFNNSSDFDYKLKKDEKLSYVENFSKNRSVIIDKIIKYKKQGEFTLPSIWINNKYIDFGENERTVIVDNPFERYFNFISLLFAGFIFILGVFIKDIYLGDIIKRENMRLKMENIIKNKNYKKRPLIVYIFLVLLIIVLFVIWVFKLVDLL